MKKTLKKGILLSALLLCCGCTRIDNLVLPPEVATSQPPTETTLGEPSIEQTVGTTAEIDQTEETTTLPPQTLDTFQYPDTRAGEILQSMTLEEKVGQLFLVRSQTANPGEYAAEHNLGGIVLFKNDFAGNNSASMREKTDSWQAMAQYGLILATDEEGGEVTRLSCNEKYRLLPFASPRELYAMGGMDIISPDAHEKAYLLAKVGVNLNLAPVCDLSGDPEDYIYERSISDDPQIASEFVTIIVKQFQKDGVGCTLKHFPGYGSGGDTHTGAAEDERTLEQLMESDLLPFKAGIDAGAEAVMMSHLLVKGIDEELPVSLSPKAHSILREDLGFTGVIITDSLAMEAVTGYGTPGELAVMALKAGNDMLCTDTCEEEIQAVLQAVESGELSEVDINRSVLRILELKLGLGII